MTNPEDTLDHYLSRFSGMDLAGVKVRDLLALKALIVELREGSTPPAFDIEGQINRSNARGDVRREFARRVERAVL